MRFIKIENLFIQTDKITDVRDDGESLEVFLGERSLWLEGEDAEVFRRWIESNSDDLYEAPSSDLW